MKPYERADKTIAILRKRAIRRFRKAQRAAQIAGFDALNVLEAADTLYGGLSDDNEKLFLQLAKSQYAACKPHGKEPPDEFWLYALLEGYDPITKYVYDREIARKQAYLVEAVMSSKEKDKPAQYRKSLSRWQTMTAHYADSVSDKASLKSYEDAGVRRVRWNTQQDGKVCETCKRRNGKVYPIDQIPDKPHWGCRCYFTPVDID